MKGEGRMVIVVSGLKHCVGWLCVLALVSIGLNLFQYHRIQKITQPLAASADSGKPAVGYETSKPSLPATESAGQQAIEELTYQIRAAKEELGMVNRKISDYEAQKAQEEAAAAARKIEQSDFFESRKTEVKTPAYRKTVINSFEMQYPDLFKKLQLSLDEFDKFKELWADQQIAQEQFALEHLYEDMTKDQWVERMGEARRIDQENQAQLAALIGAENYERYQYYMETQTERIYVQNFTTALRSEEKLTDEQVDALVTVMHETEYERVANQNLENESRQYNAYLEAAGDILSASQIEKFEDYFGQQLEQSRLHQEQYRLQQEAQTTQ